MTLKFTPLLVTILSVSLGMPLTGCRTSKANQNQSDVQNTASGSHSYGNFVASGTSGITTTIAQVSNVPNYIEVPAQIEVDPTRVVHVYPPTGGRITAMKVRPWDRVEKGQTLAVLDSSDLARAVADYQKAQIDSQVKQKALERATYLYAHSAIAQKDLQQAQGDAEMAKAEGDAARTQLRVLGVDPNQLGPELRVVAPRSGVILDVGASEGEYSNALAAAQPLCTIADISSVWAVGDIYEKDLSAARPGELAAITLDAYPRQSWNGRVDMVSNAVDPNTRTLHVRVVLANPAARLKPAMFGSIRLLKSMSQGILVPSTAVVQEGETAYVFVRGKTGQYQRRTVTLGRTIGASVEITGGVKTGDTVVTQGALMLREAAGN